MIGWVANHTGLPSLYVTEAGTVKAGERVLATAQEPRPLLLSDALAVPGKATTYTVGSGPSVTLTRAPLGAGEGLISDLYGRRIPSVQLANNRSPAEWASNVSRSEHSERWPTFTPKRKRTFEINVPAELVEQVWALLESKKPIVIGAGSRHPGVPGLLVVTVDQVKTDRWGLAEGQTGFEIRTTDSQLRGAWKAPVFTWAEMAAFAPGWWGSSWVDVARQVSGMPS